MYTSANKLASFSAICCAITILGLILFILAAPALRLAFAASFAIFTLLIGASAGLFAITLSMRSLCQDLQYEYENNINKMKELNDSIKLLNQKLEKLESK